MLYQYLEANRSDLIQRCRAKVIDRYDKKPVPPEMERGIASFLDQVIQTLELEQNEGAVQSHRISGPPGGHPVSSEIGITAKQHGHELLNAGFSIDQLVHDYGDLCQAITDSAHEAGISIEVDEFRTLNRCLDNAIADSVTEYAYQNNRNLSERFGGLVHGVRTYIHTAELALQAIDTGKVPLNGLTGGVLKRSLRSVAELVNAATGEVRILSGAPPLHEMTSLGLFIDEIKESASFEASFRKCVLFVAPVDPTLGIMVDRSMLLAAVTGLIQNAFKYTVPHTPVTLQAYARGSRIRIDVTDNCGGLPAGFNETVFRPFSHGGSDNKGMGLGLSITQRSVEANQGNLTVRDIPGVGCTFTIDLPRHLIT